MMDDFLNDIKHVIIITIILLLIVRLFVFISCDLQYIFDRHTDEIEAAKIRMEEEQALIDDTTDIDVDNEYPSVYFFETDADWKDKGDYYETSEPVSLGCYDYVRIKIFDSKNVGEKIKSECGSNYTKVENNPDFVNVDGYVGELENEDGDMCQIISLGNGYGFIQCDAKGKVQTAKAPQDDTKLKIKKDALVSGGYLEADQLAEDYYSSGKKQACEQEIRETGSQVVYYPVFGENNYIKEIAVEAYSPAVGY